MMAWRTSAATVVALAVAGPLLLLAPAAPADGAVAPRSITARSVVEAAPAGALAAAAHFTRVEVETCAGPGTIGPVQCPCDISWQVYTSGKIDTLKWALTATDSSGNVLASVPGVAATIPEDLPAPAGTPTTHRSPLIYRSINTSDKVTVAVALEVGSDTAACARAYVEAGIEPKPGMCPLLDVSLTGSAVAGQSPAAAAAAVAAAAATAPANGARLGPARNWAGTPDAAEDAPRVARIVGGRPVKSTPERSMLVAILDKEGDVECTGTFLPAYRAAVTAAHCRVAVGAKVLVVPPGTAPPGVTLTVDRAITHPSYNPEPDVAPYDVSVLTFAADAAWKEAMAAAAEPWPLVALNVNPAVPAAGSAARASGFGRIVDAGPLSKGALFVDEPVLTPAACAAWQEANVSPGQLPGPLDGPAYLCSMAPDGDCSTCQGDSGGPLYQISGGAPGGYAAPTYVLVGVTSFGFGCGRPNSASVFVRVSEVASWVMAQLTPAGGRTPSTVAARQLPKPAAAAA